MGNILNEEQVAQIRAINAKQKELDKTYGDFNSWMCESADDDLIVFFHNDLDLSFYADFYGNIFGYYGDFEISNELREIVRLEGQKCQIAYYGKIQDRNER